MPRFFIALAALAVALVVVAALAIGGALDEGGDSPPVGARAQQEIRSAPLVERIRAGLVQVTSRRGPRGRLGSGFMIDDEGSILTNRHLVAGARTVAVQAEGADGPIDAEVQGTDTATDLALLRIPRDEARNLEPLRLGDDATVRVGEPAVAIGAPFGFDGDVTAGVVSARFRAFEAADGLAIDGALALDAEVDAGNSGGPLVDEGGRVIGVSTEARGGGAAGYAIPIGTAREAVSAMEQDGSLDPPTLGVTTMPLSPGLAQLLGVTVEHGLLVRSVTPGGPAQRAGVRPLRPGGRLGDVIVAVDGRGVREPSGLAATLRDQKAGRRVVVELMRGGASRRVRLRLVSR